MGFLSLPKGDQDSFYGNKGHKYVDKLIKNSRNLLIISPYIDDYYAEYLARHARGKKMHIISSSIKNSAAKKLRNDGLQNSLAAAFMSVSVNWLLFLINAFNPYFAFFSISAGFVLVAYTLTHRNRILLKMPKDFVHAKLYVGDDTAIEGSANLTYAGMYQNVENIRLISEREDVEKLKRQFWTMWNSF